MRVDEGDDEREGLGELLLAQEALGLEGVVLVPALVP